MLKIFVLTLFFISPYTTSDIYNYSINTLEGNVKQLSPYQGKKLLIISLPVVQSNAADSLLIAIQSLANLHQGNLNIIAVPSFEDGYRDNIRENLLSWYRSKLDSIVTIGEGMYTHKTSGVLQHDIFKWLTRRELNLSYDTDLEGPNWKFLISENGELVAVLGSQIKVGGLVLESMLNAQ